MDTVYLRIKFTPLVKNIIKTGSHYTLEIIPKTSCLENIDKIQWNKEKDAIEYTVPVTYKILIKKQDSTNDRIKIYHSCVDIMSSTSLANVELSAGDVPRHNSEYSILNKTIECVEPNTSTLDGDHCTKANISIINDRDHRFPNINDQFDIKLLNTKFTPLLHENLKTLNKMIYNEEFNKDFKPPSDIKLLDNSKINIDEEDCNINKVSFKSDVDMINEFATLNKRKLLISPFCDINMADTNIVTTNVPTYFTDRIMLNSSADSNIKHEINKNIQFNRKFLNSNERILPEQRVAEFVRHMGKEILPLKILLNDIINKCVSSDIYKLLKKESSISNSNAMKLDIKNCGVIHNLKSNRVIYSIVFHE